MDANQRNYKGQLEINDLIGDAVKNAVSRRNEVIDSEDALSALSNDEVRSIAGGITIPIEPIIAGYTGCHPPITLGIIALPEYPIA